MKQHDESAHYLMAPQDVPQHVAEHHGVTTLSIPSAQVEQWMTERGIEPTDSPLVDAFRMWHELAHQHDVVPERGIRAGVQAEIREVDGSLVVSQVMALAALHRQWPSMRFATDDVKRGSDGLWSIPVPAGFWRELLEEGGATLRVEWLGGVVIIEIPMP